MRFTHLDYLVHKVHPTCLEEYQDAQYGFALKNGPVLSSSYVKFRIDKVNTFKLWSPFMDKQFDLNDITFIWDENKARKNLYNHEGITFEQAAEAFFDPFLKVVDASRNEEERDAVIGMDKQWNVLFVVHIAVEEEFIRIISARYATRQERRIYED